MLTLLLEVHQSLCSEHACAALSFEPDGPGNGTAVNASLIEHSQVFFYRFSISSNIPPTILLQGGHRLALCCWTELDSHHVAWGV